jgi:general secretion pathway protein F
VSQEVPEIELMPEDDCGAGRITLDQFIALNDELAALVRAGLPLERGLRELGQDIPGALGDTVQVLATRLSGGETLPQALAAERFRFPGVYRAVVEAGLKAGRLSVALEGLAGFARSYADLRRAIGMALIYPLIVLTVAYGLFVLLVLEIAPKFLATYTLLRLPVQRILVALARVKETLPYWGPVLPLLLVLIAVWWVHSGRVLLIQPAWTRRALGWLPWVRPILANSRSACFAELLGMLVEHEVPLHESMVLAAEATSDEGIVDGARELAGAVQRGESVPVVVRSATVFPPMLRWLMLTGLERGVLAKSLRHAAQTYRELALHQSSLAKQLLPVALLLAIGGTAALVYCLSVFVPYTELLHDLAVY